MPMRPLRLPVAWVVIQGKKITSRGYLRTSAALTHRGSVRARRLKKTEQNLRNDGQPTVFYLFV